MSKGSKEDYTNFMLTDRDRIADFISGYSDFLGDRVRGNGKSEFVLLYKMLTHSDLGTFGKAMSPGMLEKNLLYYMTTEEMRNVEERTGRPFQTARQSNIGLKGNFYTHTGLIAPCSLSGRNNKKYFLNDYADVYLVNESLKYFSGQYTKHVFDKLHKIYEPKKWNFDNLDVELKDGPVTPISLHCAAHGLGTADDKDFHALRHHMFKGDSLILLCERTDEGKSNLFITLSKNPVFFSLVGEAGTQYTDYLTRERDKKIKQVVIEEGNKVLTEAGSLQTSTADEVGRKKQAAWRRRLADEMMAHASGSKIVCPFTYLEADFKSLGALFVASHIKEYANSDDNEKYDINNGLLLSASADALFDKHLITIGKDERLEFSFLLKGETKLLGELNLVGHPIYPGILNDKRMEYAEYHRMKFKQEEEKRKMLGYDIEDEF